MADQTTVPARSFGEMIRIVGELKAPVLEATKGKKTEDYLQAAGDFLDVLIKHDVTLAELKDILGALGPLAAELLK